MGRHNKSGCGSGVVDCCTAGCGPRAVACCDGCKDGSVDPDVGYVLLQSPMVVGMSDLTSCDC